MNSTNDTSFTEPMIQEPENELQIQCNQNPSQYSSPQNNSNMLKLKQNFDDIIKAKKNAGSVDPNEVNPFILM